jgi:hypothetical protein
MFFNHSKYFWFCVTTAAFSGLRNGLKSSVLAIVSVTEATQLVIADRESSA